MGLLIYMIISKDKPELSLLEAKELANYLFNNNCCLDYFSGGVLFFRCRDLDIDASSIEIFRLSYIREFGLVKAYRYIDNGLVSVEDMYSFLDSYVDSLDRFKIDQIYVDGTDLHIDWVYIRKRYSDPGSNNFVSLIISPKVIAIGSKIAVRDKAQFDKKSRITIDFRSPGSMNMIDQNFMVNMLYLNISKSQRSGKVIFDPFLGTGKLLLRPCMDGHQVIGADILESKCRSSAHRLKMYKCENLHIVVADTKNTPIRNSCIDAIITDLPYGRQSSIVDEDHSTFINNVLKEFYRVLKANGTLIMSISHNQWINLNNLKEFKTINIASEYIHSSLIRVFLILKKK